LPHTPDALGILTTHQADDEKYDYKARNDTGCNLEGGHTNTSHKPSLHKR
jgi:hypothetical protein